MDLKRHEVVMESISGERTRTTLYVLLILLIVVAVFGGTVMLRKPFFNTLSQYHHQWQTGDTLRYSRNWYREGPLALRFGMFFNPASAEFPDLSGRNLYCSYPPGAIIPIYLISKITNSEPSVGMIHLYNLFNHFMIAFFLAWAVFLFLRQIGMDGRRATVLSIVPALIILLTPAGLYWHQNVFFVDEAVILPIVLFVFLELSREHVGGRRGRVAVGVLQGLVFFYGMLTDWLFAFFALAVFLKRLLLGEFDGGFLAKVRKSAVYWTPAIIAVALFAIQISILGGWGELFEKALFRTGLGAGGEEATQGFFSVFWSGHIAQGFGGMAVFLLWGSFAVLAVALVAAIYLRTRKRPLSLETKTVLSWTAVFMLPCFAHAYVFRNHTAIHSFSALKFELPLATVPLVLLPLLVYLFAQDLCGDRLNKRLGDGGLAWAKGRESLLLFALVPLAFASIYISLLSPRFLDLFPSPTSYIVEGFVSRNAGYGDVLFSYQYAIPDNPPQQLAMAMKRVYKIDSVRDAYEMNAGIKQEHRIGILVIAGLPITNGFELPLIAEGACEVKSEGLLRLYILSEDTLADIREVLSRQ